MTPIEQNKIKILCLLDKMEKNLLSKEEYKELQRLLLEYEILFRSNRIDKMPYPLCKTSITGDKIMFVSDTHHGHDEYENEKLTDYAYNTAIQQSIENVVHAGDLTESTTAPQKWDIPYNDAIKIVEKELKKALDAIPNELQIKLLLGNHDYTTIKRFISLIPYFTKSPKIDLLGMQRVLLNWDDYATIYLDHYISQLAYPEESVYYKQIKDASVIAEGHHHGFRVREDVNTIDLPSTSNDTFRFPSPFFSSAGFKDYSPIYVIASKQGENKILFEAYCTNKIRQEAPIRGDIVEVDIKTKKLKRYN